MPGGTGRGIALGLEQGARNFLDSYMAVKKHKADEKYRKMAPIVQAMMDHIKNPHTTYDEKMKAYDALPYILDPNYKGSPLSQQMGLDKIANQQIEIERAQTEAGAPYQPFEEIVSPDTPMAESIQLKPKVGMQDGQYRVDPNAETANAQITTQKTYPGDLRNMLGVAAPVPDVITKPAVMQRRGELSDSDLELAQRRKLVSAEQEDQFTRQWKLAELQNKLQERLMDKQGWKLAGDGEWTYNEATKSWGRDWFNPMTGQTQTKSLAPGIIPESIMKERIRSTGRGGAYRDLTNAVATTMDLPADDPRVALQTAQLWKNNFETGVQLKQQTAGGTRPPSPDQVEGNRVAALNILQKHNEFVSQAIAINNSLRTLEGEKDIKWREAARTKGIYDKIVKDGGEPGDPEYNSAFAQWNTARDEATAKEKEYQSTLTMANQLNALVQQSQENIQRSGINPQGVPSINQPKVRPRTTQTQTKSKFSSTAQSAIADFRKANPNVKKSDDEILIIIQKKRPDIK